VSAAFPFFFLAVLLANMKTSTIIKLVVAAVVLSSLTACNSMTRTQKHAAIGAGAGGALGYLITGGPIGTVAGAAAGGLIGAGVK
jgi:osmotically inducible lipoprotein OsmB